MGKKAKNRVLILNPDVKITYEEIERLCRSQDKIGADILFPQITDGAGEHLYQLPTRLNRLIRSIGLLPPLPNLPHPYTALDHGPGACMLVDHSVFEEIGYLNEEFFMYFDEVEFCFRARKDELLVAQDGSVEIFHDEPTRGSRYQVDYQIFLDIRNRMLASRTVFNDPLDTTLFLTISICVSFHKLLQEAIDGNPKLVKAGFKGIIHGLCNISGKPRTVRK